MRVTRQDPVCGPRLLYTPRSPPPLDVDITPSGEAGRAFVAGLGHLAQARERAAQDP